MVASPEKQSLKGTATDWAWLIATRTSNSRRSLFAAGSVCSVIAVEVPASTKPTLTSAEVWAEAAGVRAGRRSPVVRHTASVQTRGHAGVANAAGPVPNRSYRRCLSKALCYCSRGGGGVFWTLRSVRPCFADRCCFWRRVRRAQCACVRTARARCSISFVRCRSWFA